MTAVKRRRRPHLVATPLRKKGVITIPQDIRDQLDLREGDQLVVAVEDGRIILTPASVVPDDQAWFWSPEWQAKEREVEESLSESERGEVHEDGSALLRSLADDAGLDLGEIEKRADV
ncbi:AbrB/MazE/SpoVT family DNA-binding domain-containing protein [Streptomyces sp. TRM66268-LWL]|uniref:AbrB/MazE/SpoVT family DNA-binding domain-containing protein n=1 Tax=Streptomyces polyasparticus TaxID=2767826 RepID=A0ABR7SA56_9ACTN|nr:AbrB/MazE/SpoVT family DNA-binding domain-containing protein [Streptomyces polyasparticus]MBC9711884.1 AbrB/MazE/SpoVT family DNA-binding domain-containing protein [Streptomyces polyasparticus]